MVEGLDYFGRYDDRLAETWLSRQECDSPYTTTSALKLLEQIAADNPGIDGLTNVATVYGNGNRWPIYLNGVVAFSSRHGTEHAAARELGFKII